MKSINEYLQWSAAGYDARMIMAHRHWDDHEFHEQTDSPSDLKWSRQADWSTTAPPARLTGQTCLSTIYWERRRRRRWRYPPPAHPHSFGVFRNAPSTSFSLSRISRRPRR